MSEEHDWLRNQLSSLPRPTVPEDVAQRLDHAIAAESGAPVDASGAPVEEAAAAAPVVPLQASRASRGRTRALLALGGAAAAVVVFTAVDPFGGAPAIPEDAVGIAAAPFAEDSELSDAPGSGATDSDDTTASAESAGPNWAPDGPDGGADAELDRISLVMTATDTPYSRAQLADQAGRLAAAGPPLPAPSRTASHWSAGGQWPAATLAGVRDCVAALPASAHPVTFVDQAEFEGEPALVVARQASDGAMEVFVQAITCTATDPAISYRTTVVP